MATPTPQTPQDWQVLSQSWQIVGQSPASQPPGSAAPASSAAAQASPQKAVYQQQQQQQQQQQLLQSWQVVGQASQLAPGGYGYQPSPGFVTTQAFQVPSSPMQAPFSQVPPGVALPGGFAQQQPSPMGFQQAQVHKLSPPAAGKKLFGQDKEDKTLGGIILTLCDGSSYDPIFKEMSQSDDDGTVVAVYAVAMRSAEELGKAIEEGHTVKPELAELLKDLQAVPKEKVVFNWECCSGCSEAGFPHGFAMQYPAQRAPSFVKLHQEKAATNVKLAKLALDRGYMVMFADFSLKALIASWSEELLGPNPFRQLGVTQGRLRLTFSPETLQQSSSKQLVKVGELCTSGTADINAMGSTIVYGVVDEAEKRAHASGAYKLQRLTEAAALGDQGPSSAGHVMLTYPSGGRLLTSAGHWKELTHLGGVSEEALLRVAEQRFGQAYSAQMQTSLQQCKSEFGRQQMQQGFAQACVQSYTPY